MLLKEPLRALEKLYKGETLDTWKFRYLEIQFKYWLRHDVGCFFYIDLIFEIFDVCRKQLSSELVSLSYERRIPAGVLLESLSIFLELDPSLWYFMGDIWEVSMACWFNARILIVAEPEQSV